MYKKKKKHMKRLSLITQFKIEFLLPFTGCRKKLGKILNIYIYIYIYISKFPLFKSFLHG